MYAFFFFFYGSEFFHSIWWESWTPGPVAMGPSRSGRRDLMKSGPPGTDQPLYEPAVTTSSISEDAPREAGFGDQSVSPRRHIFSEAGLFPTSHNAYQLSTIYSVSDRRPAAERCIPLEQALFLRLPAAAQAQTTT